MSQLTIKDLTFCERISAPDHLTGGLGFPVKSLNAALGTALDADLSAGLSVSGPSLKSLRVHVSAGRAGATAGAVAYGGKRVMVSVMAMADV